MKPHWVSNDVHITVGCGIHAAVSVRPRRICMRNRLTLRCWGFTRWTDAKGETDQQSRSCKEGDHKETLFGTHRRDTRQQKWICAWMSKCLPGRSCSSATRWTIDG